MATVKIGVGLKEQAQQRLSEAFAGHAQGAPKITFATHALMWRVLTPNRWAILEAMTGQGPLALREIARRVERDVKGVHTDVHALLDAGIVRRTAAGAFEFPYDAVRVDFTLRAAA